VTRPTVILSDEAVAALRRLPRNRKGKTSTGRRVVAAFVASILTDLLSGYWLMILIPYAHQNLGTPDRHPGWWPCVVVVALASAVAASFRPTARKDDK
jgi:hypothetical protein